MSVAQDLAYMSVTDLADRIRHRDLSPIEVVDATIERIEERNPSLNAFIFKGFDDAREAAKKAEQEVASGSELGRLHGVPVAIKDLFDSKPGWPATFGGIRLFKENIADWYCIFAERIETAGAILVGKTNSPVMGFRGTCDNPLFGATNNPFDTTRSPGGSSGGSAAAVADGLVPLAEGTDGGGSIRIPAAWSGVYGYKASFGRIPCVIRPNAFSNTMPFVYEGPLTRHVADAALAVTVLSGYHPRDPFALDEDHDFTAAVGQPIAGKRIAYSPDLGVYPVDRRVAATVAEAVKAFEEAGAHVEEIELDIPYGQRELSDLWCRQIMLVSIGTFEYLKESGLDLRADHRDEFPPQYLRWIDETYTLTAAEINRDNVMRSAVYDAIQDVFETHDLLVSPTLAAMQTLNSDDGNTVGPSEIEGVEVDELIGWCMTYFMNFSGHPAASIPAGMVEGLPVGLQIIGRRYADVDVLAASAAFEQARPWQHTYQACIDRPL